jgi:hypothetical protein
MANVISLPNFPTFHAGHATPANQQRMPPLMPALRRARPELVGDELVRFRRERFGLPNAVDRWITACFSPGLSVPVSQGVGASVAAALPWDSDIFSADFVECRVWKTTAEVSSVLKLVRL